MAENLNVGVIIDGEKNQEDDSKIERWFKSKTSEFEERLEKAKKEREDKEYQDYLKLKEKYENK